LKRVVVTRPRSQAGVFGQALKAAGFEPVYLPVIQIRPIEDMSELDQALSRLGEYDWLIFTSVNGVDPVWERMEALKIAPPAGRPKVAAIGPKTAQALTKRGLPPDFVPEEYVAEAILPGLGELAGKKLLLPRAEIARKALPQAIAAAGGQADEIAIYQTLPAEPDPVGWQAVREGVQAITFTSPSTVHFFMDQAAQNGVNPLNLPGSPLIACIGPITAAAAESVGLPVSLTAGEYTTEGLAAALQEKLNEK
jgi:uroporphyrinogen-III synthase